VVHLQTQRARAGVEGAAGGLQGAHAAEDAGEQGLRQQRGVKMRVRMLASGACDASKGQAW
jgi:hypothetical protein